MYQVGYMGRSLSKWMVWAEGKTITKRLFLCGLRTFSSMVKNEILPALLCFVVTFKRMTLFWDLRDTERQSISMGANCHSGVCSMLGTPYCINP